MRNALIAAVLLTTPMIAGAQTSPAAAPAPAPGAAAATDRSQEIVCRRDLETGSLVKAKKTCHTRAQWAYIAESNQNFSRDLVDSTRSRPGGGN